MKRYACSVYGVFFLLCFCFPALADIVYGINIDFIAIGGSGNTVDPATGSLYGSVDYNYRIGKYEITNAQWNAFTAAAGVPTGNPSNAYYQTAYFTSAQQPTNNVSWYEAAQFCNYLTSGNKSLGAYQLGTNGDITVNRAAAVSAYGTTYVIPTENEWYKAAYYKSASGGYSSYANGQDTIPAADNGWNYTGGTYSAPWDVGTGAKEQNGTYDMMGNIMEWNETLIGGAYRGIRGGSYASISSSLKSSYRLDNNPYYEYAGLGFRVASIPEPCSLVLLGFGGFILRKKL